MSDENSPQLSRTPGSQFLPLLLLLFIGSGCAALIYEIVWLQLLQLLIGSTAYSLGVLLGTFMGGMCLGSLLLPRVIPASYHPLRVYAFLELGVGAIGLAVWLGYPLVEDFYTNFGHGASGIFMRAVVSAICLLPPTILMGATLPAIARWVETTPSGVSWLGLFYSGNIGGAVFGCLLAGFYLLRVFDMGVATYVAVMVNVTVALCALGLSAVTQHSTAEIREDRDHKIRAEGAWSIYLAIALSGLCALGAEVVWTRTLSLLLGGTVYTFSIILAVFLVGLGIGSNIGAILSRGAMSARLALGVCQMLIVGGVAWTAYMVSSSLPYWPINPGLSVTNDPVWGPWLMFQLDIVRVMWAVLPAACLWGASFPLALAAAAAPGQDPGRLVGGVYAVNTVGAIIGSLAFSLFIIPTWSTQFAQQLLIGVSIVSAVIVFIPVFLTAPERARAARFPSPVPIAMILPVALVAAGFLAYHLRPLPWGLTAYGRHLASLWVGYIDESKIYNEDEVPTTRTPEGYDYFCIYQEEGINVSVAVTQTSRGIRSFHGAGKVQASGEYQDMRLQRMLGHLSALGVEKPKDILVVACGAGVTAGTFLVHPEVENITICDIEPVVPKYVTPHFSNLNFGITDDMEDVMEKEVTEVNGVPIKPKKVKLVFDDGRHFVRTTQEKYDVITSDPIDPWVKGCAALNTVEYYQMCKEKLNDGGVMSLWIPLYESNEDTFKSILTTFFEVFPNGILWSNDNNTAQGYDAVLFGVKTPEGVDPETYQINLDQFMARLDRPDHEQVRRSLQQYGFSTGLDLLAGYAGRAKDLKAAEWTNEKLVNRDRNLRLQYLAGMWFNSYQETAILGSVLSHYYYPTDLFVGDDATLQEGLKSRLNSAGRYDVASLHPQDAATTPVSAAAATEEGP